MGTERLPRIPWEQREGWEKPPANSPGDLKRSYIQAKYVWEGFVEGSTSRLVAGGGWGATRGVGGDQSSSEGGGGGSSSHSRRSSRGGGGVNGDSMGGSDGFEARGVGRGCGRCDCRSARRWGVSREPSRRWPTAATHDGRTPTISTGQPCIATRQPETWVAASS
ncbi:unnamed protein product [Ectocarpus fasciculatus]